MKKLGLGVSISFASPGDESPRSVVVTEWLCPDCQGKRKDAVKPCPECASEKDAVLV
jgi:rubredoxin